MEHDFRRRCEAALTHPVTLAALALLLVNDIVFKALFPGAWAVGKLSDLAWVIFASPLLAFALSFAVPKKSAAGRRAALFVAYGGLPLLYAAFNTFAPVHDAVMGVLTLGADGAASGSPMDATDSLVIPFGLAIAAWVWRRGVPAGGRLRFRFAAPVAGIAALASVASTPMEPVEGITLLAATSDGTVLAGSGSLARITSSREIVGSYWFYRRSDDGGMSWSPNDDDDYEFDDSTFQAAETPRGEYVVTDSGIALIGEDGQLELVYSTEYLRGDANKWMQENDTQGFGRRFLTARPNDILYHADSGNVIAAMGIQGVVVGTPDGRWRRVAVGDYAPTDFSFSGKTQALGWVVGAIALTLSLSALTIAAAASAYEYKNYRQDRERDVSYVILIAFVCLAAVGMMFAAPLLALPVAALTSWIAMLIAAAKSEGGGKWRFALLGCVSTLPPSVGLLMSFGVVAGNIAPSDSGFPILSDSEINAALAFVAFASLIFPLAYHVGLIARHWRAFALAFLGMNALIALAFVLWLQMNVSLAATQAAIVVLVGLAAVVLVRRVRAGLRADLPTAEGG